MGEFYVAFDKMYKKEVAELMTKGRTRRRPKKKHPASWAHSRSLEGGRRAIRMSWSFGGR